MERTMNRPSLPPLRLALPQIDNPGHPGSQSISLKHKKPAHLSGSVRSNGDLSLYSLSSSSSQRGNSTSSLTPSRSSKLAERASGDDLSPMTLREGHTMKSHRQCSTDLERASGSRSYAHSGFENYSTEAPFEKFHQVGSLPERRDCRSPTFSSAFRRGNSTQYEDTPARVPMVMCHSNSNVDPADNSPDHHPGRLNLASSSIARQSLRIESQGFYNQTLPTAYPANSILTAPIPQAWKVAVDPKHRSSSETRAQSRIQPIETASGPRYFCPVWGCGKSFTRNFNLTQHISAIHKDERRFECSYCMATFYRRNDLTRHERAHTGERPYHCECGQGFTRTDLLSRHKQSGNCPRKRMN